MVFPPYFHMPLNLKQTRITDKHIDNNPCKLGTEYTPLLILYIMITCSQCWGIVYN